MTFAYVKWVIVAKFALYDPITELKLQLGGGVSGTEPLRSTVLGIEITFKHRKYPRKLA